MSLLDTIKAARQEAAEAGTLPSGSKKADDANTPAAASDEKSKANRSRRSSAASARPTRDRAGSVRTTSDKPKSEMTKEEKRAAREKQRAKEDVIYDAKKAMLDSMPEYKRTQRVWWGMLIAGIICTLVSWGAIRSAGGEEAATGGIAVVSISLMVLAYVLVIGAFIYDLVKVRPLRNRADAKLTGMSEKRMRKFAAEEAARKEAEKEKK